MINEDLIIEHINFGTDDLKDKYDTYNSLLEKMFIELDFSDKAILGKIFDLHVDTYFKDKSLYKNSIIDEIKAKTLAYFLKNNDVYIGGCVCQPSKFYINTCMIYNLVIFSEFRSQGYGKYLLKYILNDLKVKYKFKYFGINCLINNNAAMKLYRSIGFSPISTYLMKI